MSTFIKDIEDARGELRALELLALQFSEKDGLDWKYCLYNDLELKTINKEFGDECLGELGGALKYKSFLSVDSKSKLKGKKQLGLWK